MNNPNNVGEDIDNLNEELMGKWKKGLKNIKHSSLGGNNMYYEDEIYHDGYLDGYYAGMELYHADEEMTEEERARRKKRRRAVALGVGIPAGAAALGAGIALPLALRKRRKRNRLGLPGLPGPGPSALPGPVPRPTGPRLTGPKLKRVKVNPRDVEEPIGWDFKRNRPRYRSDKY